MTRRSADATADLPRWASQNALDRVLMALWVFDHLDAQLEPDLKPSNTAASRRFIEDHGPQYEAAMEEDFEPLKQLLRAKYPKLVKFEKFLKPLKRSHGRKKSDVKAKFDVAGNAYQDLRPRIRDLWKQHYGKVNRPKGDITAMEIAAQYVGIPVRKIERKQKKGGKAARASRR